ncbi:MAG: hypothetical protein HC829_07510, partial [Bacteroidales bacterium]|nr:hypothetical protein [Bacteroidales bacterium]
VAFSAIVERGLLQPGTTLTDGRSRFAALVRADGTLEHNSTVGSIHRIGALVQGAEPATAGPSGTTPMAGGCGRSTNCAPWCARIWQHNPEPG